MTRAKWASIVTLANAAIAALVILVVYAMMTAVAAFAAYVENWPLFVLLFIGLPLSIIGLRLTRGFASRSWRYFGYFINGTGLAILTLLIIGVGALFISSTEQQFIIPEGYQGDIYVLHGAMDGAPEEKTLLRLIYRIPQDGILRTRSSIVRGLTRGQYYYVRRSGVLRRIWDFWPSTVDRTSENLANDRDVGVYFPHSGTIADSAGCLVDYEAFYVGTKAYLLTRYQEKDIRRYIIDHGGCERQSK